MELPAGRLRERARLRVHPAVDRVQDADHRRRCARRGGVRRRVPAGDVADGLLRVDEHHLQHHRDVRADGSQVELEFRRLFLHRVVLFRAAAAGGSRVVRGDYGDPLGGAGRAVRLAAHCDPVSRVLPAGVLHRLRRVYFPCGCVRSDSRVVCQDGLHHRFPPRVVAALRGEGVSRREEEDGAGEG